MISKGHIDTNLRGLEVAYRKARSQRHSLYFSKLAILELCGWIEVSMDDMVERHSVRHLKIDRNRSFVKDDVIRRNSGFDYERNFRLMLMKLVGICELEALEKRRAPAELALFASELHALKGVRNRLAHTYLRGKPATIVIDAPSVTRARLTPLFAGLQGYDTELRRL